MSIDLSNTYLLDYESIILKVYDSISSTWKPASFQCSSIPQTISGSILTFPLCSFGQYAIYSTHDGSFIIFWFIDWFILKIEKKKKKRNIWNWGCNWKCTFKYIKLSRFKYFSFSLFFYSLYIILKLLFG